MKKRAKNNNSFTKYMLKYKRIIISMIFVLFLAVMLGRAVTYLNAYLVDSVLEVNDYNLLIGIGFGIFGLLIIEAVFYFVQNVFLAKTGYQIASDIRKDLFSKLVYAPLEYHETTPVAMAMTKASTYINDVGTFCYKNLIPFIINLAKLISILLFMIALSPLLSLLIVGILTIVIVVSVLINKISKKRIEKYKVFELEREKIVVDSVFGLNEIMTNNGKNAQIKKFEDVHDDLNRRWFDFSKSNEMLLPIIECIWYFGIVVICIVSYLLLGKGSVALGVIVSFLGYISQSTEPIQQIANNAKSFAGINSTFRKIFEVLDVDVSYQSKRNKQLNAERVDLQLKNVSCAHKFKGIVLENVNLEIPFGTSLQIFGESGSGKTTLCSLISRLYEPSSGKILFNDLDSSQIENGSFVNNVGMLTGEVFFFDDTLMNNLLIAKTDGTRECVEKALETVGLKRKVDKLPNGINSNIVKNGDVFSAGERQLLALARLIIQDPKVIIIDEAVCSADERAKEKVAELFNAWKGEKTCIYISTRKERKIKSDKFVELQNGKIISEITK